MEIDRVGPALGKGFPKQIDGDVLVTGELQLLFVLTEFVKGEC